MIVVHNLWFLFMVMFIVHGSCSWSWLIALRVVSGFLLLLRLAGHVATAVYILRGPLGRHHSGVHEAWPISYPRAQGSGLAL